MDPHKNLKMESLQFYHEDTLNLQITNSQSSKLSLANYLVTYNRKYKVEKY
jgi:hypothetical protein